MVDPLAEVVTLLQPRARYAKLVQGASPWRVSRSDSGQPFYCVVLEGGCCIHIQGHEPIELQAGDFAHIPETHGVSVSSLGAPESLGFVEPVALGNNEFRIGPPDAPVDVRMLVGHCSFGSQDASLLVSLLPRFIHVRGEERLATLVRLVRDESRHQRPAREVVLAHFMEVLLIEALRSTAGTNASPGLVRGLADPRVAAALRALHDRPAHEWTVADLAKEAALSRSTFFERFSRLVGVAPMQYLLAWRMAVAKDLLSRAGGNVAQVAERVGYGSASAFSVAFTRHVGCAPSQYALLPTRQ